MEIPQKTRELSSFLSLFSSIYEILTLEEKNEILNIMQRAISRETEKEKQEKEERMVSGDDNSDFNTGRNNANS